MTREPFREGTEFRIGEKTTRLVAIVKRQGGILKILLSVQLSPIDYAGLALDTFCIEVAHALAVARGGGASGRSSSSRSNGHFSCSDTICRHVKLARHSSNSVRVSCDGGFVLTSLHGETWNHRCVVIGCRLDSISPRREVRNAACIGSSLLSISSCSARETREGGSVAVNARVEAIKVSVILSDFCLSLCELLYRVIDLAAESSDFI